MTQATKTLKDILNTVAEIESQIEASKGEITPELETALTQTQVDLLSKIDAYHAVMERLDLSVEYWKRKEDDAKAVRKSLESAVDNFKERLKMTMLGMDQKTLVGDEIIFTLNPTRGKVEIVNQESAEVNYGEQVVTTKVNLDRIRKDLENGIDLGAAKIVQTYSLRTKANKEKK